MALLAGVGTGVWASVEEACERSISVVSRYEVEAENCRVDRRTRPRLPGPVPLAQGDFATITEKVARLRDEAPDEPAAPG